MRKLAVAAAMLLLAASAIAQTPDQLFAAGRTAFLGGENEKAANLFEKAIKANPRNADYYYWLGNAYGRQARSANLFKQASLAKKTREAFEKAVSVDPNHLDARMGLISYYMMAPGIMGGSEEKAQQQAAEVRKRDALQGHVAYAQLYAMQKKPELAQKEYIDAIREQPNSAKARYFYALSLIGQKNYKGAFEELETAIRLEPAYLAPYFRIGVASVQGETNHARAEQTLKHYLTQKLSDDDPPHARAWYWLGRIYEQQGRKAEAKNSYATSLKLAPGAKDVAEALKKVS